VGLIAREIERRGIATVSLSSAYSITRRVNPPRAVYVDFPLGHTAGKPHDKPLQRRIMIDTLSALDGLQTPGMIRNLPYTWDEDDSWKDRVMRPGNDTRRGSGDDRTERFDEPQYQLEEDRRLAAAGVCPGCIWLQE